MFSFSPGYNYGQETYLKKTAMRAWSHAQLDNRISQATLIQEIDNSDSSAVARYVQRPYTATCSFRVMREVTDKAACRKETAAIRV